MKETSILFSGPMVRAILEGRKTMTRRVVHPQPSPCGLRQLKPGDIDATGLDPSLWYGADPFTEAIKCPYGQPGDRLWVRETWCSMTDTRIVQNVEHVQYRADFEEDSYTRWRPSIFMPRWASRITLEITSVRVERVQDITEEDAKAEGIETVHYGNFWAWKNYLFRSDVPKRGAKPTDELNRIVAYQVATRSFGSLWDSINAKLGFGWDANPYVWVVGFRRIQ